MTWQSPWIWAALAALALAALALWVWKRQVGGAGSSGGLRFAGLLGRFARDAKVDAAQLAQLRELLLLADVGPVAADRILGYMRAGAPLHEQLEAAVLKLLESRVYDWATLPDPAVILLVGTNGSGKTTTCAKLALRLKNQGRAVVLGAADTFRAAAAEQLLAWGERLGVRVVRQQAGADPAAVAFAAAQAAQAAGATAMIDTAGRLHGDANLLAELAKIARVLGKAVDGAPHAVWLTLDSSQGQSAIDQARQFNQAVRIDGIIVNKVDGEGKGGFLLRVLEELPHVRVVGLGTGEGAEDFVPFSAVAYARRLVYGDTTVGT